MVKLTKDAFRTQYLVQPPLEDWVHGSCKIMLLGDAAHAYMVGSSFSLSLTQNDQRFPAMHDA